MNFIILGGAGDNIGPLLNLSFKSLNVAEGQGFSINGQRILSNKPNDAANNLFVGVEAGNALAGGTANTFLGKQSGRLITSGTNNLCVGFQSGDVVTTGSNGVYLGDRARAAAAADSNCIVLGSNVVGSGSNTFTVDTSAVGTDPTVANTIMQMASASGQVIKSATMQFSPIIRNDDVAGNSNSLTIAKSTSGGLVAVGTKLGTYAFQGHDGNGYQGAGSITAETDAATGAGNLPTAMNFFTTPAGTIVPTKKWKITNAGVWSSEAAGSDIQMNGRSILSALNISGVTGTLFNATSVSAAGVVVVNNNRAGKAIFTANDFKANTSTTLTVTNSTVSAASVIIASVTFVAPASPSIPIAGAVAAAGGSFTVVVKNVAAATDTGAISTEVMFIVLSP